MEFLSGCENGNVREVSFRRGTKVYPSLISKGNERKWGTPIQAQLSLFEYAKRVQIFL